MSLIMKKTVLIETSPPCRFTSVRHGKNTAMPINY